MCTFTRLHRKAQNDLNDFTKMKNSKMIAFKPNFKGKRYCIFCTTDGFHVNVQTQNLLSLNLNFNVT